MEKYEQNSYNENVPNLDHNHSFYVQKFIFSLEISSLLLILNFSLSISSKGITILSFIDCFHIIILGNIVFECTLYNIH